MIWTLIGTYVFYVIGWLPCYVLSWYFASAAADIGSDKSCTYFMTFAPFYALVIFMDVFHTVMTCYINIQFSRELTDASR